MIDKPTLRLERTPTFNINPVEDRLAMARNTGARMSEWLDEPAEDVSGWELVRLAIDISHEEFESGTPKTLIYDHLD